MKKKLIICLCAVIAAAVLLLPVPLRLKDGGTVEYRALLYSVSKVHRLNPDLGSDKAYLEGTVIEILGIEVYNDVR